MKRLFIAVFTLFFLPISETMGQEKKVIIIDAGHGGTDRGAIGADQIREKDITLRIAQIILRLNKTILDNTYDIYLTRYADTLISLHHRTKLVRVLKPDLFISLHCNHAKNRKATGIEIYLHNGTPNEMMNQKEAKRIALCLMGKLTQKLGYRSRGIKSANFQVLRKTVQICPSILVELGFLSNVDEAGYLKKESSINALALAVLMSIKI